MVISFPRNCAQCCIPINQTKSIVHLCDCLIVTIDFVRFIGMQHWTQFRKDGQSISRKTDNHNFVHFNNRRRRRLRLFWQKVCFFFWRCVFFFFWCLFCLFRLVLFADLKRNNLFAQECRLVGLTIDRDVGNDRSFKSLQELRAKINVSTRTLEVGTIISDEVCPSRNL